MTLEDILRDSYRRLGYSDEPEGAVTSRLAGFADEAQREILREPGMEPLIRTTLTFTSASGQSEYGLPMGLSTIDSVRDIDGEIALMPMSEDEYRRKYVDPSRTTGRSYRYVPLSFGIAAQAPSTPADVVIVSTSALDVQTAFWTLLSSVGEIRTGSVQVVGTSGVSLSSGTVTNVSQIIDVYLSQAANGTVTLRQGSTGGTELCRITQGYTKPWRRQLALVPTPSEARVYTVVGTRAVTELLQATDEPVVPPRFHPMIGVGVRKREFELRGNMDRWAMADKDWREWMTDLRRYVDPTHGLIIPGGLRTGWSSLGPNFPAEWYR